MIRALADELDATRARVRQQNRDRDLATSVWSGRLQSAIDRAEAAEAEVARLRAAADALDAI